MPPAYHVGVATPKTAAEWKRKASRELARIVEKMSGERALRRLGPKTPEWQAEVALVSAPAMTKLNGQYRGKRYATDVLSFPAPKAMGQLGMLGELVICLPVLKRQAKEQGHSAEKELQVLLVHGALHLLGMDHELGETEARLQRRWEAKMLKKIAGSRQARGLIERNG